MCLLITGWNSIIRNICLASASLGRDVFGPSQMDAPEPWTVLRDADDRRITQRGAALDRHRGRVRPPWRFPCHDGVAWPTPPVGQVYVNIQGRLVARGGVEAPAGSAEVGDERQSFLACCVSENPELDVPREAEE